MCDTIAVPARSAADNVTLFGKNSDRPRNEAQLVQLLPAAEHSPEATVTCTYITIPQVRRTNAVLSCRPFWIWGAEMGANEHGVVIGNEAVHARGPLNTENALTGMDLLRLALERADCAERAVEVIVALLEEYGQGGDCGHLSPTYYNNSFLIVDAKNTFVLETVGRHWLLERATGVRTISNRYGIERADRVSAGLRAWIEQANPDAQTWQSALADAIADPAREHIGSARARRARTVALLGARDGLLSVADVMRTFRDHSISSDFDSPHPTWTASSAAQRTVCMHAGTQTQAGQTAGSLVSELRPEGAVHWLTATALPCTSIFKPVLMDVPLPPHGCPPTDRFDAKALWWRHEHLNRMAALADLERLRADIAPERDAIEEEFRTRIYAVLKGGSAADRARAVAECWRDAIDMEERWHSRVKLDPIRHDEAYVAEWHKLNQLAEVSW